MWFIIGSETYGYVGYNTPTRQDYRAEEYSRVARVVNGRPTLPTIPHLNNLKIRYPKKLHILTPKVGKRWQKHI